MANTPNTLKRNESAPGGSTSFSSSQLPGEATGRIGEAASQVADKARETVSNVGEKASEMTSDLQDGRNKRRRIGSGLRSFADSIREHSPSSGMLGSATKSVADSLESGGRVPRNGKASGRRARPDELCPPQSRPGYHHRRRARILDRTRGPEVNHGRCNA